MQSVALIVAMLFAAVVPLRDPSARVHDDAALLSAEQRASLETLARDVEQQTTAQIAIVTVNSLDGKTVDEYAHELFNKWGIGDRKNNNGVLFLIAPRERRMRIEVGWGLEPLLTDGLCGEIRDNFVIPRFKANDFPAGIIAGTQQIANALRRDPQAARGIADSRPLLMKTSRDDAWLATMVVGGLAVAFAIAGALIAARRYYSTATFVSLTLIVVAATAIAAFLIWRMPRRDPAISLAFGGTGAFALVAWGFNLSKYRRFGPHGCSKCGTHLQLLNEQDEDPKLSAVQQLEEQIGSVDYDVWICPACLNNDTERYIKAFSGFTDCPKCGARTFKTDSPHEITAATQLSTGEARIDSRCVSCNHKTVEYVTLPRIVVSQTSSGSNSGWSGGGWSGGGGGGFGGGGGGGFGGGGSGGGGASGGW